MSKRIRKGNHPSNPYAAEAATAPRHEDRPGWPFPLRPLPPHLDAPVWPNGVRPGSGARADLSDEAQLGPQLGPAEPTEMPYFLLSASDPLGAMLVRAWANMAAELGLATADDCQHARMIALQMDEWRRKRSGR